VGRPWWYDSYWEKGKKSTGGRFHLPRRQSWVWIALVILSLLLATGSTGPVGIAWFLSFVYYLCRILVFAVFIRVILSWFMISRYNRIVVLLDDVTEPILSPLRRVVPRLGMFDVTPLVAFAILYFIPFILNRIFS